MKKFILETSIVIFLICISGFFLHQISLPSKLANRIHNIDSKLAVINLGSSHGNNFDYSNCVLKGERINKEGNTLYYDLQNYIYLNKKNYLTDDAIVIIPVSYYVFGLDENRTDRGSDDSFVNDYYYYLPDEQIFSYSEKKRSSLMIFTIQKNFYNLIFSANIVNEKNATNSTLKEHANSRVIHHKRLAGYSSKQKNVDYLESLINEVIKNKHLPLLVTTPYHNTYNNNFGKEWLDENYFNIMHNISLKFNINYLDYSDDNRLFLKDDYFDNSDHLNYEGRKIFSSIIFHDIEEILFRKK